MVSGRLGKLISADSFQIQSPAVQVPWRSPVIYWTVPETLFSKVGGAQTLMLGIAYTIALH